MAYSRFGLFRYLPFHNSASSLSRIEKTIINLTVSQYNVCSYCLSEHTFIAKMNGISEEDILQIRIGNPNNSQWNALAGLVKAVIENRGVVKSEILERFFEASYNKENMIDAIMQVSECMICNYLCNLTEMPVDFPPATEPDFKQNKL